MQAKKMQLSSLDHYNIETVKHEETVWFYSEVLGLVNAPEKRPNVGGPGTWLMVAGHPAIHVNFITEDCASKTGAIDHIAFVASGYQELEASFGKHKVPYKKIDRPDFNGCQLYVVDPNQIKIELNIRDEIYATDK